jgi:outer membrane protein insertion porin family
VPKRALIPGTESVPSSSFQRPWPRVGKRVLGFGLMLAAILMVCASVTFAQNDVISEINVTGNRRIPKETILPAYSPSPEIFTTRPALERDFNSLWNTGYFEDIKFLREQTPKGWRIIVQVKEKPTIREIPTPATVPFPTATSSTASSRTRSGWWWRASTIPRASRRRKFRSRTCWRNTGGSLRPSAPKYGRFRRRRWAITFVIKEGPKVKGRQDHQVRRQ